MKKIKIPNKEEIRIIQLEKENNLLKEKNSELNKKIAFHEELIAEIAIEVYG